MVSRNRPLFALLAALLLVAGILVGFLGFVLVTPSPPSLAPGRPVAGALTRRLLLVIVDGLRWDVATDPSRMPHFSRALREEAGGELTAGKVSMTTSAILAIGTGQRGGFEQIARNARPAPVSFDSWLARGAESGLSVMSVGDPAWVEMYGKHLAASRVDPKGVAIDVDFNPTTFRDARELAARSPNVLIVHFVTPDHQAHAHSVPSKRYAAHIRGFDRDLFAFLDELGPEWTLIVAGDHGAADSGTHGADTAIQRRTAVFARGPGIVRGAKSKTPIDQADLAGTIATLLGLPLPTHSRGHLLIEWLDVDASLRASIACADARRAGDLARALGFARAAAEADSLAVGCPTSMNAFDRARGAVARVDAEIESKSGLESWMVPVLLLVIVLLAITTASVALGSLSRLALGAAVAVGAVGIGLTWGVERLPGGAPSAARFVLFSVGNVLALVALLWPGGLGRFLDGNRAIAAAVLPGFLLATYTTNAQPEAYVALAIGSLLLVLVGGLDPTRPSLLSAQRVLRMPHILLLLGVAAVLCFAGTRTSDLYPAWLRREPWLVLGVACGAIGLAVSVLGARSTHRSRWVYAGLGGVLIVGALLARRFVPPWPGRFAILVALAVALVAALRAQRLVALLSGLFAYAWISRDAELIAVVATLLLADGAGAALARHRVLGGHGADPLPLSQTLLVVAFLFGVIFVLRIGIQGAIDFGSMDWGAAGFGDPHVSAWIVGGALGMKYALAMWLVLGVFASEIGARAAEGVLAALFVVFVARAALLAAMFLTCGGSFWTGLRVLGDLPFAMLWSVATGLAWVALRYSSAWSSSS